MPAEASSLSARTPNRSAPAITVLTQLIETLACNVIFVAHKVNLDISLVGYGSR
jgi:hypothetical protein